MNDEDPVRWLEQESQLSPELARAMARYAQYGPGSVQHAAQRAALMAKLGPPPAALATARSAWYRAGMGLGTLVVAATAWWWLRTTPPAERTSSARPPSALPIAARAPAPQVAPMLPSRPADPAISGVPTASTASSDGAAGAASVGRHARVRAHVAPQPAMQEGELALLARARRMLASAPDEALRLTELHQRRYSAPSFAQERELLAIEALVRRGDQPRAEKRAAHFARRYPHSVHRERLRVLLEPR